MFIKTAQNICKKIYVEKQRTGLTMVKCSVIINKLSPRRASGNWEQIRKKKKKVLDRMVAMCYYKSPRTKRSAESRESVPCKLNNV